MCGQSQGECRVSRVEGRHTCRVAPDDLGPQKPEDSFGIIWSSISHTEFCGIQYAVAAYTGCSDQINLMNAGLNKCKQIYVQRIFSILKLQMCIVSLQGRAIVVRISYIFIPYKLLKFFDI